MPAAIMVLFALLLAGLSAATAIPASLAVGPQRLAKRDAGGGTCTGPDFVNVTVVGAPGPYSCESDWGQGYLPITNLTVWSSSSAITGIQVTYSDGTLSKLIGGTPAGTVQSYLGINYGQGDKFTKATLYGQIAAPYTNVQRIELETIKGGKLAAGQFAFDVYKHDQPTGIGILFGLEYTVDTNGLLAGLGFVFLEPPITEIQITDIQFPDGPVGSSDSIYPRSIGKAHFYNNASEPQTYQFNNQVSMTQTYTFMQAFTFTFTVMEAIAFKFDLQLLSIGLTTTFVWTLTETTTFTYTHTDIEQVQYNTAVTLDPGKGVDCFAVVGQGAGTFFYTSLVTLSLKNGHSYTFPENGYVTVQAVSEGEASCSDANHP